MSMLAIGSALALTACARQEDAETVPAEGDQEPTESSPEEEPEPSEPEVDLDEFRGLAVDMDAWKFDSENGVFYQLGIPYCLNPTSEALESLAIFVPGAYFSAKAHGRTYSCVVNERTSVGVFSVHTAPVVMPINSGTLGAQASPAYYGPTGLESYLSAGCVYVYAGFRGRNTGFDSAGGAYAGGDPWPAVDLKAAVRFLRYNASVLPGDMDRICVCGFSMGGGLSAVMGASGDSELYTPYLEEIGAATHDAEGETLSDSIFASASWCPVTSFDSADASYEWMMGQYSDDGTRADGTWTALLSHDLAAAYGAYINDVGLTDAAGQRLALDETSGEVFADGSYYAYLLDLIEKSASDFFENTPFPYTYTPQHVLNASFPGDPSLQTAGAGTADVDMVTGDASAQAAGVSTGDAAVHTEGMTRIESVVYNTQSDYVNNLNADAWWLTFNETRGTVRITSLGDFVRHFKRAAKDVGAFDAIDRSSLENQLFGVEDAGSLHFSSMMRDVIVRGGEKYGKAKGYDAKCAKDWTDDLDVLDGLGTSMQTRMGMFNPLYFLSEAYEGAGSSKVAAHWRINSGLFQTDTSLCTEANLALALETHDAVSDVAFTTVWGQGHVLAERSGTADENLVAWIASICES